MIYDAELKTFSQASARCKNEGMKMLVITNEYENDVLTDIVKEFDTSSTTEGFWLGISDAQYEGEWENIYSKKRIDFKMWADGRPLNSEIGRNKDCAVVNFKYIAFKGLVGLWSDVPCNSKRRVICERLSTTTGMET